LIRRYDVIGVRFLSNRRRDLTPLFLIRKIVSAKVDTY